MNKINNNKTFVYFFSLLISLVMLMGLFSLATTPLLVSADTTNESVLNFNQMIELTALVSGSGISTTFENNNLSIRYKGTATATQYNYQISNTFQLVSGHKYYYNNFADLQAGQLTFRVGTAANPVLYTRDTKGVFTSSVNLDSRVAYVCQTGVTYDIVVTPQLFDLTLMFGAGNEPTIEEINNNNYFPTYYNRIVNLPITESLFTNNQSAYIQGYNDALTSFNVTIGTGNIYDNLTPYNYNGVQSTIDKTILNSGDYTNYLILIKGYGQISLTSTIEANTPVRINLGALGTPDNSVYSIVDFYFLQNGTLNKFASFDTRTALEAKELFYLDVIWPTTSNLVFLRGQTSGYANNNVYISNVQIEFKTINVYDIINNAYQNAERYYQQGQPGYNAIFQQGFDEGQRAPAIDSAWSFVSSTFSSLGGIFAVEFIPGVPIWVFIAIPLLFGLIVFIYKLAGGN